MQSRLPSSAPPDGFDLPVRVYYEDTDAAGVVYYANYLRFCERARTEWLRQRGLEQRTLLQTRGLGFVVGSLEARYLQPARLDDALIVRTVLNRLGGASLEFAQYVLRAGQTLFVARVRIAAVDGHTQKAHPLPADLRGLIGPARPPSS